MNNTFDYARFGKLFRKHTVENYKSYLMSAGVLCGCIILFYSYLFSVDKKGGSFEIQMIAFVVFYLAGGTIFTSTIFSDYGQSREAVAALTLPASHFEKFLIGWLYSFLIFTGIFLLCFYAIDIPFVNGSKLFSGEKKILDLFNEREVYYVFFIYAMLHAFAMYGAIFFKRLHFIKTVCLFFLFLLILTMFHHQLMKSLIAQEIHVQVPFEGFQVRENGNFFRIELDKDLNSYYATFLFIGLSLALWAGTYFQLKEKQL